MKKPHILVLLATLSFVSPASAAPQNLGPEKLSILTGGSLGDVPFSHRKHQTTLEDCSRCHKLLPQAGGSVSKLKAEGELQNQQVMNQCRDCHRLRAEKGEKSGPTNCSGCHHTK